MALSKGSPGELQDAMPQSESNGTHIDLHEVAKGWKAAIARAKDPGTR